MHAGGNKKFHFLLWDLHGNITSNCTPCMLIINWFNSLIETKDQNITSNWTLCMLIIVYSIVLLRQRTKLVFSILKLPMSDVSSLFILPYLKRLSLAFNMSFQQLPLWFDSLLLESLLWSMVQSLPVTYTHMLWRSVLQKHVCRNKASCKLTYKHDMTV